MRRLAGTLHQYSRPSVRAGGAEHRMQNRHPIDIGMFWAILLGPVIGAARFANLIPADIQAPVTAFLCWALPAFFLLVALNEFGKYLSAGILDRARAHLPSQIEQEVIKVPNLRTFIRHQAAVSAGVFAVFPALGFAFWADL